MQDGIVAKELRRSPIQRVFLFFAILSSIDFVLVLSSEQYRGSMGFVDMSRITPAGLRIAPSVWNVFLCCLVAMPKLRGGDSGATLTGLVSLFYLIESALGLVPFVGFFFVLMSPIAPIYWGAIHFVSGRGIYIGMGFTLVFLLLNLWAFTHVIRSGRAV